jgi:hypothetical protein
MTDDLENSFIMRNWEELTRQTKKYFKKIIREFDEVIYIGEKKKDKSKWDCFGYQLIKAFRIRKIRWTSKANSVATSWTCLTPSK